VLPGSIDDHQREASIPKMERSMKKSKLPKTDSIQELAEFWDSHDLTDFEDEFEEVAEPVFVRGAAIKVPLQSSEIESLEQMARAKGISKEELIRAWVLQKLARRNNARPTKH
jgi:predicted DNA binding CopG/RHH family protein